LHAEIIESSFKPVFVPPINGFDSIRLDKWMFFDRGSPPPVNLILVKESQLLFDTVDKSILISGP
jgi:hypothetical protein